MVRFVTDNRKVETGKSQPLMVIGAGLPRAATSSMQLAFEQLGYDPCLHMAHILPHPDRIQTFLEAVREDDDTERRHKLLHKLTDGHLAVCDMPTAFFTADFMDMYPDAKIVLNGRPDSNVWSRSAEASLGFFFTWRFRLVGLLWTTDRLWYSLNMEAVDWCKRKFGQDNYIFSAKMYNDYYAYVRTEAAKRGKEVLEFKAEDGWEPLCKFLEKPVPDTPFPRANEAKTFTIIKTIFIAKGLLSWAALGGSIWAAWTYKSAISDFVSAKLLKS